MRIARNALLWLLATFMLFVVYRFIDMTREDEMLWFAIERRSVLTADAKPIDGWLHREWKNRFFIVTRNDQTRRESYLINAPIGKWRAYVQTCGDWAVPRIPIFPFQVLTSDVLGCHSWSEDFPAEHDRLPDDRATVGSGSLEFIAKDGSLIRVHWN